MYYKQIFQTCSENLSLFPSLPLSIASQVVGYDRKQLSQENLIKF